MDKTNWDDFYDYTSKRTTVKFDNLSDELKNEENLFNNAAKFYIFQKITPSINPSHY